MFIIIKDKYLISTYKLDSFIDYNGIHIYSKNDAYYIELTNSLYFEDNTKSKRLELKKYIVLSDKNMYGIEIYAYENDFGFESYKLYKNIDLVVANNPKANIYCKDNLLSKYYLSIRHGVITSNYDVIVNGKQYNQEEISEGSLIEYLGLKIYYFKSFLYINSFCVDISIPEYVVYPTKLKYKDEKFVDDYYIPEDIHELKIPELVEYKPIKKINNVEFVKSIIPNIIMSVSMSFMSFMNYTNIKVNNPETNILSYVVMPISMILTSVFIPILFTIISSYKNAKEIKKNRDNYIQYLNEYKDDLLAKISEYIKSLNSRFFDLFNSKKMMFYANPDSSEFLTLSIGHTTISKQLDIEYQDDKLINDKLKEIEEVTNNIDDYPVFVDIKKHRKITIVSKRIDKEYFFRSILLQLVYKHHYDDIKIAVYSKDKSLFDAFYNLPHLFINDIRLTLITDVQVQLINQIKTQKPLILLMYDKCNVGFDNENIHQIYFSASLHDILKDSSAIIEHLNNDGYIYSDNKLRFKYVNKLINFNNYFEYLGRLQLINTNSFVYSFKDVFDLDISKYYNNKPHGLCADFAFNNNELVSLDLHESKQGPHGLIGGSTGSGKSELIISLLLSLCIRYSPEYLNIVLIDYKGGGIKESLSYNGKTIPHIIASVSNLENNILQRLIIALNNECKFRQNCFKKLSNICNTSIMNIDDYLDNYSSEYGLRKMAHLLIVVDEFAELKKENPEQIKELISISRIGRSLGIHLILATQKPSGVIDDEIWSNSRFKLALKVFDEKDSQDIIQNKNAAYLSNPGSFYLKVDGNLIRGQAIYSKSDINGNEPFRVSLLNNLLEIDKTYKNQNANLVSTTSYFCEKIIEASKDYNIDELQFVSPLEKKRKELCNDKSFVFGEIDDYLNAKKGTLTYGFNENILIYSSRKNEINSILNSLNENGVPNIVIGSKIYEGLYTSDSVLYDNQEDINYLFKRLLNNKNNCLCLIVEDLNTFLSYDDSYLDMLIKLAKRSESNKLTLVYITSNSQISFKIINSIKNKVLISIYDKSDIMAFFGTRTDYVGSSFFFDSELLPFIPIKIEDFIKNKPVVKNVIEHIPDVIKPKRNNKDILIGYNIETKQEVYASSHVVITSLDSELLQMYKDSYDDIETKLYDYKTLISGNEILWLGSGVFNQRLFVASLNNDLSDEQGVYIKNNKKVVIRRINDAPKINEI